MEIAKPPGCRSTMDPYGNPGRGGEWEYVREIDGSTLFLHEIEIFKRGLADSDKALLVQEVILKMNKATEGKLLFGSGSHSDVDSMGRRPNVLELRLDDYNGYEEGKIIGVPTRRHVRMYFSEPECMAGKLIALSLKSKCPGPLGLQEQNDHIDEADRRLCAFEVRRHRKNVK